MNVDPRDAPTNLVADSGFASLAFQWMQNPASQFLTFVWAAYDKMRSDSPNVDDRDLERSITQLLEPRIRDAMTGDEPYYIQHGPFERETMAAPPAQPPAYDLAFVLRANERVMWPLEAKVLETPGTLAEYEREVREQYLTCRYAPFMSSGAMLAYLLSGATGDFLNGIAGKLCVTMAQAVEFPTRPHQLSNHKRTVPEGKSYPVDFVCHHLVLEYPHLKRHKKSATTS